MRLKQQCLFQFNYNICSALIIYQKAKTQEKHAMAAHADREQLVEMLRTENQRLQALISQGKAEDT